MAILSLITMVGTIVLILATVRIAEPPDPSQIGGRSDFVVGPIHRNGALTQWIVAGGETLASIAIRPAPKTSPRDLRFGVRLLDDRGVELASSGASVAQTGPDGWLVIPLMPTPLTAGRRYGLQLSVPSREGTYLYVDATNFRRIGWGPIASGGLDVNGAFHPEQSIQIRIHGAGGFRAAAHMLVEAARSAPAAAGALFVAWLAWLVTIASSLRPLVGRRAGLWSSAMVVVASVSLAGGTGVAAIAWLLG